MKNIKNLFFVTAGIYLLYKGHPGWGLFSCWLGFNFQFNLNITHGNEINEANIEVTEKQEEENV